MDEVTTDEEKEAEVDSEEEGRRRQPRKESRGSECSDYEQWVEDNLLLPDPMKSHWTTTQHQGQRPRL